MINKAIKEQHFVQLFENKKSMTRQLVVFILWVLVNTICWFLSLILALKDDTELRNYAIYVGLTCVRTTFYSIMMVYVSFILIRFSEPPS